MDNQNTLDLFGKSVFNDSTMRKYLSRDQYSKIRKVIDNNLELDGELARKFADSMKNWAIDQGAKYYTHWFQPLNGATAEKHNSFLFPNSEDGVIYEFPYESLFIGESDASSFPSGGLRSTFEARGYTKWDYTSPAFIKEYKNSKILCIPTVFVSHSGESLDKKYPLIKSCKAINEEALKLIDILDREKAKNINKVFPSIGAEQEYFLISKEMYNQREDLRTIGRTLFGAKPSKAQQMSDHYLGNIKEKVASFMDEVDLELLKLGILSATRHNEVAPCQYELAPYFGDVNLSTDQNQLIMETLKSVAEKHDLVCLLHEKPFDGVNGSGKHNNWSLTTDTGENLLSMGKNPKDNTRFLLIITAVISAIDEYSDLLRASTATASNDRRLSGYEAPPTIISVFIGEDLKKIFDTLVEEKNKADKSIVLGETLLKSVNKFSTDRNRTSPFAFVDNRFEFRMPGSSTSVAVCNTILNVAVADKLSEIVEKLKDSENVYEDAQKLIIDLIEKHSRIIYNGNGYSKEWVKEAEERGLKDIKSSPEALKAFIDPKALELFSKYNIYTEKEVKSRYVIKMDKYSSWIDIEAQIMLSMAKTKFLPTALNYSEKLVNNIIELDKIKMNSNTEKDILKNVRKNINELYENINTLSEKLENAKKIGNFEKRAENYRDEVIKAMNELRENVDNLELILPKSMWPIPTYSDIFLED